MTCLIRPMKLNVNQINYIINEVRKLLYNFVKQIKYIFNRSNVELNLAKQKYIIQINTILETYNIDKTFTDTTSIHHINRFLYNYKKNKNLIKDVRSVTDELDKYFDTWRRNEYLLRCYEFNSFFEYSKQIYNNTNYNKEQICIISVKLSNIIDFHEDTIKISNDGETNANIHFSKEGIYLVNTLELVVLEQLNLLLEKSI